MNNRTERYCQHIEDDADALLSGDAVASPIRSNSAVPAAVVEQVFAELDGISAAFAVTPDTVDNVSHALTPEQLEELDAALASLELPTAEPFDFGGKAEEQPRRHARLREEFHAKHQADMARNKVHGHIAQGLDAIDEHRKTPKGRADYNANRRQKRHAEAAAKGKVVRPRTEHATDEERRNARRAQKAASKANRSPAQIEKERAADRERKAASRRAKKEAAKSAIAAKGIF